MTLTAGQKAITSTRIHSSSDADPRAASYVDDARRVFDLVIGIGKQGFSPRRNKRGEALCRLCPRQLRKTNKTAFCPECTTVVDVILSASRNPTSAHVVS